MLLKHLTEATDPIYKVWANHMPSLEQLAEEIEDDGLSLLVSTTQRAVQKYASDPMQLLPLINPMIKMAKRLPQAVSFTFRGWLELFLNALAAEFVKLSDDDLKLIKSKVDLNIMAPFIQGKFLLPLQLSVTRASRSQEQKKFDDENDLFVFIGRPSFVESPPGSDSFKRSLEIERLVKVDRHDPAAHQMVHQMKMRAGFQGQDSQVYLINLPRGVIADPDDLDDWMIDLINKHKQKV